MQIKKAPVKDLVSPEWNPRQITTEELEKLKTSLEEFGYIEPIIVNDVNNHVVGGNQRLRALIALGYDEVDCVYVHITDINKEKACNVALNKISGDWDEDKLRTVLEDIELSPIDIKLTGFDELELTELEVKEPITVHEDDFIIEDEEDIEVNVKEGDLYRLGEHYLLCGDSTNAEDIERLMRGNKADLVFTDPPYNMEVNEGHGQWVGDVMTKLKEQIEYLCDFDPTDFLLTLPTVFDGNMNAYIFCNKDLIPNYLNWAVEKGYSFNILFWKKPNAIPVALGHRPDVEYLLFFRKNAIWNRGIKDTTYSRCLEFGRDHSTPHPTMKPLGLIANELKISSNEGSIVVDLFGGSGSTLIACEQLNRNCYMMELDPYYCQVIINRWEEYTGRKAEKLPL